MQSWNAAFFLFFLVGFLDLDFGSGSGSKFNCAARVGSGRVRRRALHGLKTEARTRPVPEIVWPDPTRPERHS